MRIGLCISGGFARGSAQAGFLKAMFEVIKREDIALITSSSIGAINAICISNNTMDYLEFLWKTIDVFDMKNLKINLGNKVVDRLLEDIITLDRKLEIPTYMTGTCLNNLSTHYFYCDEHSNNEEIHKILNVTLTFPFVNGLFRKSFGRFYIDGGGTDNIPVYPFYYRNDVDMIIILHCYPHYLPPKKAIESGIPIVDVDVTALVGNTLSTYSFSQKNLRALYDSGYEYGKIFAKDVLEGLTKENTKERFQAFIRKYAPIRNKNKINLSAAVFFNKLQFSRYLK